MIDDTIDLDDFLSSRSFDVQDEKIKIYEAVIASLLRKYVPRTKKVELNLLRAYTDTVLDIVIGKDGAVKISWGEHSASI